MKPTDSPLETLVRALYAAGSVNREVLRRAVPEQAPAALYVLALVQRGEADRVSAIADRLRVDASVASRQARALELQGLLRREADASDGRAHCLRVTDAGQATLDDAQRRIVDAFSEILSGWEPDEIAALSRALGRLRDDFVRTAETVHQEAA